MTCLAARTCVPAVCMRSCPGRALCACLIIVSLLHGLVAPVSQLCISTLRSGSCGLLGLGHVLRQRRTAPSPSPSDPGRMLCLKQCSVPAQDCAACSGAADNGSSAARRRVPDGLRPRLRHVAGPQHLARVHDAGMPRPIAAQDGRQTGRPLAATRGGLLLPATLLFLAACAFWADAKPHYRY